MQREISLATITAADITFIGDVNAGFRCIDTDAYASSGTSVPQVMLYCTQTMPSSSSITLTTSCRACALESQCRGKS